MQSTRADTSKLRSYTVQRSCKRPARFSQGNFLHTQRLAAAYNSDLNVVEDPYLNPHPELHIFPKLLVCILGDAIGWDVRQVAPERQNLA